MFGVLTLQQMSPVQCFCRTETFNVTVNYFRSSQIEDVSRGGKESFTQSAWRRVVSFTFRPLNPQIVTPWYSLAGPSEPLCALSHLLTLIPSLFIYWIALFRQLESRMIWFHIGIWLACGCWFVMAFRIAIAEKYTVFTILKFFCKFMIIFQSWKYKMWKIPFVFKSKYGRNSECIWNLLRACNNTLMQIKDKLTLVSLFLGNDFPHLIKKVMIYSVNVRDSSFSRWLAASWLAELRFPSEESSLCHHIQTGSGPHLASIQWILRTLSLGVKQPEIGAESHLHLVLK
jgi:hypothetical protein